MINRHLVHLWALDEDSPYTPCIQFSLGSIIYIHCFQLNSNFIYIVDLLIALSTKRYYIYGQFTADYCSTHRKLITKGLYILQFYFTLLIFLYCIFSSYFTICIFYIFVVLITCIDI